MERQFGNYLISDDKARLQTDRVYELLHATYWANVRSRETIERTIANSLCFGVYDRGEQIAFCRCVTDDATMFWLADVIVDERYRRRGIGNAMVEAVLSHERLQGLVGILSTRDAHGLYRRAGFVAAEPNHFMRKPALPRPPAEQGESNSQ
ncbi:MAG: GNAT family N-acetyltransferase [Clostridiales bacterium]|nr:GNAT family N-acetyltransferase [Clostridiales bacterium]